VACSSGPRWAATGLSAAFLSYACDPAYGIVQDERTEPNVATIVRCTEVLELRLSYGW
jgi:hypothetical protein